MAKTSEEYRKRLSLKYKNAKMVSMEAATMPPYSLRGKAIDGMKWWEVGDDYVEYKLDNELER